MRIIGIDCSSSTIGYCVLEITKRKKIKFIACSYLKPPKKGNIFERLKVVKKEIIALLYRYKITHAAIEDIILFMPRRSTAQTITLLAIFNRVVGLTIFETLEQSPELYSVMDIRRRLKLSDKVPSKEEMPQVISSHLGIKFPYEFKKNGKEKDENMDMADGAGVAIMYAYQLIGK